MKTKVSFAWRMVIGMSLLAVIVGTPREGAGAERETPAEKIEVYKYASMWPMTGEAAFIGQQAYWAEQIAVEEINEKAAETGIKIQLFWEDHKTVPKEAVGAVRKLISLHKVPVVGLAYSSLVAAIAPITGSANVLLINQGASTRLVGIAENVIQYGQLMVYADARVMVDYAVKNVGLKRIAMLYVNTEFGQDAKEHYEKYVPMAGGEFVGSEAVEAGAMDFRTQLLKLKALNPDGLSFILHGGKAMASAVKQAREQGITAQFLSYGDYGFPEVTATEAAQGGLYTSRVISETPEKDAFAKKHEAKYGQKPSELSYRCYDVPYLVFQGIKYLKKQGWPYDGAHMYRALSEMGPFERPTGGIAIVNKGGLSCQMDWSICKTENYERKTVKVIPVSEIEFSIK